MPASITKYLEVPDDGWIDGILDGLFDEDGSLDDKFEGADDGSLEIEGFDDGVDVHDEVKGSQMGLEKPSADPVGWELK